MIDEKTRLRKIIRETLIVKNPALIEAVGLFPLITVSTSVKSAILVAASSFFVLVVNALATSLLLKKVPRFIRVVIYVAINTLILLPLTFLFSDIVPNEAAALGITVPLITVSSLVSLHCERFYVKSKFKEALIHAFFSAAGYGAVALLTGAVREITGSGTFYDFPINHAFKLNIMLLPVGGLITLGFLAALLRKLRIILYPHYTEDMVSDIIIEEDTK
ncbi:MAG: Electron transport complex protein RnfE [Firmicutes bacterium ADurb.Bin300]|jgi:electron transport complex protein RnfE|nr:MAG: Electron transport complex protein RnfE [Firmicutes bacterium ADurb.Bin300]